MVIGLGVWAAETASAANCPQRFIFCRFLGKYPDIRRRNRQKLSSLGSIFASTRSAAQTPRPAEPQAFIMSLALCCPTSGESSAMQASRKPAGSFAGS